MECQLTELTEVVRTLAIHAERHSARLDGVPGNVVVDLSATCGTDDIARAERRVVILRKAGLVAIPLIACEVISPELLAEARSRHVRVWCNGTVLDAAA